MISLILQKGRSDHYFIVGINQLEKVVRCVLCKGTRYPATVPRPNLALLDIQLPLCDLSNEKSQLEESLIQSALQLQFSGQKGLSFEASEAVEKAERTTKESLMKMFAVRCHIIHFILFVSF